MKQGQELSPEARPVTPADFNLSEQQFHSVPESGHRIPDDAVAQEVVIGSPSGVHARVASAVVLCMKRHPDTFVILTKDEFFARGNSILEILCLAAGPSSKVMVHAFGADKQTVLHEVAAVLSRRDL